MLQRADEQEQAVERPDADLHLDLAEIQRHLPLVGQPALHREGADAAGVQAQLRDGLLAQPVGRQHAVGVPGPASRSASSISSDSVVGGAPLRRVASTELSDRTVGRPPSRGRQAGHPFVQVEQVEGRQFAQTLLGGPGEGPRLLHGRAVRLTSSGW